MVLWRCFRRQKPLCNSGLDHVFGLVAFDCRVLLGRIGGLRCSREPCMGIQEVFGGQRPPELARPRAGTNDVLVLHSAGDGRTGEGRVEDPSIFT